MRRWGGGRDGGDGRSRGRDALRIVDLLVFSLDNQSYVAFSLPDSFVINFFVRVICFVRTIWP